MKTFFAILLGVLVTCAGVRAAEPAPIPAAPLLERISLSAGPAWDLEILPDGSGRVSCGAGPSEMARIPAGAFDFAQVYRSLTNLNLQRAGSVSESYAICFAPRDRDKQSVESLITRYTDDTRVIPELFEVAKLHHVSDDKTINEVWQRRPPRRGINGR